ncbi:MAG: L-iditol 2-dehydrogenase [Rhizobiales bacterium]|nr:L-iditol 2-dehydrogenase [Hyphomicrobiales bacterium]MBO6697513.1 L-iditol 2-dehydrogenase [Hyphomicrobiales bacterium]MBO6736232.1 L-iditol 2-dehydrogenase [Hyphomicrobiales bacterium]MBO6912702.1 L-iditol 2-dehydrogenase [Hyphomicrobiales bacterium]MBO6953871.1 L-iditol 2-dehydrogenase [Hyphomicrobiales bacterium]
MKRLEGKCALITGAARGIGFAFAQAYVREGAQVVIADIDGEAAKAAADTIGSAATAVEMDVSDQLSIAEGVDGAINSMGQIDVLINNAAIFSAAPIVDIEPTDFQLVFDINVAGTLFTLQAVARHMIARGGGGKIINMASQAGRRGEPLVAVYCASKAAVVSLTQSAGLNLIEHGINVNAISPGVVDGEHWDGVDALFAELEGKTPGQKKKEVGEGVPFGRMGQAEDLTGMAVFLATAEADYIVAQTFNVDGGQWMS